MIAHVAEAGEDRGRVVLRLGPTARHSPSAVAAAMRVAAAYGSELESLFVEDEQLFELARFPFVREIAAMDGTRRELSLADLDRGLRANASLVQRRVAAVAKSAGIRVKASVVRDEPVRALSAACAASGPWNVIVLGEPMGREEMNRVRELFAAIADTTGIVVVGDRAGEPHGPVVAVVEELGRLPPMLRAAQKLAAATGAPINLVFLGHDADYVAWMEAQARLAIGETLHVSIVAAAAVDGAAAGIERLARLGAGFIIAQFGGIVVPADTDAAPLSILRCPLFLVR